MTVESTGCGFDPNSRKRNIYLNLYFHFFALKSEVKSGVEFRHSTRNTSQIRQKVGNGVSYLLTYTRFPLPTLLTAGYSVKLFFFINITKVHNENAENNTVSVIIFSLTFDY